jgi:hypothetical protein
MVGGPQSAGQDPQNVIEGILSLAQNIEQTLLTFAQAMPTGARFFQEAVEIMKQGIAAELQAAQGGPGGQGGAPPPTAASPTNAGPQFPGGGFSSGA